MHDEPETRTATLLVVLLLDRGAALTHPGYHYAVSDPPRRVSFSRSLCNHVHTWKERGDKPRAVKGASHSVYSFSQSVRPLRARRSTVSILRNRHKTLAFQSDAKFHFPLWDGPKCSVKLPCSRSLSSENLGEPVIVLSLYEKPGKLVCVSKRDLARNFAGEGSQLQTRDCIM